MNRNNNNKTRYSKKGGERERERKVNLKPREAVRQSVNNNNQR